MTQDADHLAYRARALAQAHPLTSLARRFIDRCAEEQRTSQPLPETGIWASAALLNGYCLRRVEEEDAGVRPEPAEEGALGLDELEEAAARIAADLRTDEGARHVLGDDQRTVAAMERLIASDVERRLDHWRESVDKRAWTELGEYIAWWVVKGYALRVAETSTSAQP